MCPVSQRQPMRVTIDEVVDGKESALARYLAAGGVVVLDYLWSLCGIGQAIIFLPCCFFFFYLLLSSSSSFFLA